MVPKLEKNLSLTNFDYADDVELLSDPEHAQKMLDDTDEWSNLIGLKVGAEITKFMIMNHPTQRSLSVNLTQLERVECFTYLGSILSTNGSSDLDIQPRIHKA
ncbi:hypothetical protein QYM36_008283 [Artemia franciscana]|uniref:Reverse transcriptase domain-containing protein n=1 Tax=Artemia franciscana TaxID=6661 RepID=A0AA88IGI5_ARTSF|nr:hypothetical protein QYM36_008283 [Artemia franciscana]